MNLSSAMWVHMALDLYWGEVERDILWEKRF